MKKSVFKTEAGRDKVRAYYNRVLDQFPFGRRYVETTFGQTFMLTAGDESNLPIILLHGSCSNSAFWFPEIMALSNNFRVYAVDIVGEAGNSEEYRPDLSSEAFALWMKDVLDALGLERAVLIGNSLGGWMALVATASGTRFQADSDRIQRPHKFVRNFLLCETNAAAERNCAGNLP